MSFLIQGMDGLSADQLCSVNLSVSLTAHCLPPPTLMRLPATLYQDVWSLRPSWSDPFDRYLVLTFVGEVSRGVGSH